MLVLLINALLSLIGTLVSILTTAEVDVVMVMLDNELFKLSPSSNLLAIMEKYFGALTNSSINIGFAIIWFAVALTFLFTLSSVIESNLDGLQGKAAEHPLAIVVRGIFTLLFIFVIFGVPVENGNWFMKNGLLYEIGNSWSALLSYMTDSFKGFADNVVPHVSLSLLNTAQQLIILVFEFSLFKGVLEAGVVYVERWLSFALYILFGPVAVSCYASKKMNATFGQWLVGIISQFVTIFATIFGLRLFLLSLENLWSLNIAGISSQTLLDYAIALACLSFVKNSEKIVNALGFKTIANGDTARMVSRGAMAMTRNVVDPFLRPLQRAAGRSVTDNATERIYQHATRKHGDGSWQQATADLFRTGEPNRKIRDGAVVNSEGMLEFGKQQMTGNILNGTTKNVGVVSGRNEMLQAVKSVNDKLVIGAATKESESLNTVQMKDVARSTGLSNIDGFKTSEFGIVSEVNGKKAIMFTGSQVDLDGNESAPKQYCMVMDKDVITGNENISIRRDVDSDGNTTKTYDSGFSINYRHEAIQMREGSGHIYEVNSEMSSQTDYLNNHVRGSERDYISEVETINNNYKGDLTSYQNANVNSALINSEGAGEKVFKDINNVISKYNNIKSDHNEAIDVMNNNGYFEKSWMADSNFADQMFNRRQEPTSEEEFTGIDDYNNKI